MSPITSITRRLFGDNQHFSSGIARQRRLQLEQLEDRCLLSLSTGLGDPFAGLERVTDAVQQAYAERGRDLAQQLTTTASAEPIFPAGGMAASALDWESLFPETGQSGPLMNVDTFRADPRFAGVDGRGYSVVVLDTGINLTHPFFGDRIVYSRDFADGDADATDVSGHGSHVTSIVASQDSRHPGVAPGADIIHLKVFKNSGEGSFSYVEQALQWVVANAADYNVVAVNMSLGDMQNHSTSQSRYGIGDELAALAALDVITVSASGNGFHGFNSAPGVAYPSSDRNSLSVGAVYDANSGGWTYASGAIAHSTAADRVAPFSQRHAVLTDVFAPGAVITGAGHIGTGTTSMHGTSQAAPQVTGAAVLAQQLAMERLGRRLTVGEFQALLQSTGVMINDGDDEHDNVTNTGLNFPRLDMLALGEAIVAMAPFDAAIPSNTELIVNTFEDVIDPSDGLLSLREAVIQANSNAGDFTIVLGAGTYGLTIPGANEDAARTGDLDVLANGAVTIVGAGPGRTIISAAGLGDRVFDVLAGAALTIEGVTLTGGTAESGFGTLRRSGGGILNEGTLTVINSIISGNRADRDGGGVYNAGGLLAVRNSTVSGNSSSRHGGGIFNSGGTIGVRNSTLSGNAAGASGGGIYNTGGTAAIDNSTLFGNRADATGSGSGTGGGIHVASGGAALHHVIAAGNLRAGLTSDISGPVTAASSYNLVGAGGSGGLSHGSNGNLVGIDPALVVDPELKDNGGGTLTHALIPGSPAIDAGDPNYHSTAAPLVDDQRGAGFTRVMNGRIDIGAYEFQLVTAAVLVDVPLAGIAGRSASDGTWWLAASTHSQFDNQLWGRWSTSVDWTRVLVGDFTGDGYDDIAGQTISGDWWVAHSTQSGFVTEHWGRWNPAAGWTDVIVGDFTGDGRADIIGRTASGDRWIARSTGSGFVNEHWGRWSGTSSWTDIRAGDFTGDGRTDLIGRAATTGDWWIARSTGDRFVDERWGHWSAATEWTHIHTADFTGDGRADLVGRAGDTGDWWIARSTGNGFVNERWGRWSTSVDWIDIQVADFTGDGRADLAGRTVTGGDWWIARSTGSEFVNEHWGRWSTAISWTDVGAGDFTGDGRVDVAARNANNGQWWVARSTEGGFVTEHWGRWSTAVAWDPVLVGNFALAPAVWAAPGSPAAQPTPESSTPMPGQALPITRLSDQQSALTGPIIEFARVGGRGWDEARPAREETLRRGQTIRPSVGATQELRRSQRDHDPADDSRLPFAYLSDELPLDELLAGPLAELRVDEAFSACC